MVAFHLDLDSRKRWAVGVPEIGPCSPVGFVLMLLYACSHLVQVRSWWQGISRKAVIVDLPSRPPLDPSRTGAMAPVKVTAGKAMAPVKVITEKKLTHNCECDCECCAECETAVTLVSAVQIITAQLLACLKFFKVPCGPKRGDLACQGRVVQQGQ